GIGVNGREILLIGRSHPFSADKQLIFLHDHLRLTCLSQAMGRREEVVVSRWTAAVSVFSLRGRRSSPISAVECGRRRPPPSGLTTSSSSDDTHRSSHAIRASTLCRAIA